MSGLDDHAQRLRRFRAELEAHPISAVQAGGHWSARCRQILEDARTRNPAELLRWPSLADFSVVEEWIPPAWYEELRSSEAWSAKWFPLTRDVALGMPRTYSRDLGTSPILVQHAYHLHRYEAMTGRPFEGSHDVIFEVGGGYGSFCRLLRNAGFRGLHIILDLPPVSSIQRLYLGMLGHVEVPHTSVGSMPRDRFCLIDDRHLDEVYTSLRSSGRKIGFVATWSLSEAPMQVRERIFPRFHEICGAFLLAAQPAWEGIDNRRYFSMLARSMPQLKWQVQQIPPSFYLFA